MHGTVFGIYRLRGLSSKAKLAPFSEPFLGPFFRAAAVEQLTEWAERSGADIVVPLDADERPPSVVSRAAERAVAEGYDVLVVDTSG